eukprot:TRINITY_DN220_c0_g1_i1.p1 TRINITY_DN220_c0_g1~~TRINITY_DN220_c0_g1_i1.p1  ORF type:complete len:338 (-),score=96.62 TRINITY_DN220_c0_g1_i1:779-1792(-)
MSFLFGGKKSKQPVEIVKNINDAILTIEKSTGNNKAVDKAVEEITKNTIIIKDTLYGDQEHPPNPDTCSALAQEIYNSGVLPNIINHLIDLEFEARKDFAQIFNNLLRMQINTTSPCVEYLCQNTDILEALIAGYEQYEIALNCGSILRECIRHEPLAKVLLYSPSFYEFFTYVELSNFDVASDAFVTFKELLTTHKSLSAELLEKNYEEIFDNYTQLLLSQNYVTRRQSLKLLGELLLDRTNFNIMTRYISEANNLKLMMTLLRDPSKNIQFEAFHVFKVFVANPNKTEAILDILLKNKIKLITFLGNFQNDKDDDQFRDEKAFLIKQIQQLEPYE